MKLRILLLSLGMLAAQMAGYAQLQKVAYADDAQKLNGLLLRPKNMNAKKAGVLILPAWMGIDEHSKTVANQLGDQGYMVFIADIYGEGHYPQSFKEAGERSAYFKQHAEEYHQRIHMALDQLIKAGANPDEIAVIGYCFGGFGAIEAARVNLPVKGIVSFHGSYNRDPNRRIEPIQPKILILHGADDPNSTPEEIREMQDEFRTAKADWQMIYYANAVHAFTDPAAGNDNSKGVAYNAAADKRSWQAMLQFLKEIL